MPYNLKDLDERSIFLYACLQNAQQNGGYLDLSNVVKSLDMKERWAKALLAEAKKVVNARITGGGDGTAAGDEEESGAAEDIYQGATKTKRKAENDEGKAYGVDKKKIRAKKVKVEGGEGVYEAGGEGETM